MRLSRGLVVALAVGLAGIAGGTALAADNAPTVNTPATRSVPVLQVKGFVSAPVRLAHPASSPAPVIVVAATPTPTPTPKAKVSPKVTPRPASSTTSATPAPARSPNPPPVAAKPKPKATPRPTPVNTPKPTPAPPGSTLRTSGTLPSITIEYVVGTGPVQTWTGDSFNMTWTCPVLYADCQAVAYEIMPWGNAYLQVSYSDTITWTVGTNVTSTITDKGEITGYGTHSGQGGLGMSPMVYKTHIVVTVSWA